MCWCSPEAWGRTRRRCALRPWPACGSSVSRSARPSTRACALTAISARPARRFRRSWSRRERTWRWRARCVASCRRVPIRKRSFPEYGNKTIDRQSEGRIEAGRGAQERAVDDSGPVERPAADGKPASRPADARRRDEASTAVVEDRCYVVCRRDGDRGRTWVFLRPPARQLAPPHGLRQGDGHGPRHAGVERQEGKAPAQQGDGDSGRDEERDRIDRDRKDGDPAVLAGCGHVRRRPENQHAQVFFDVVKAVLDSSRDEDKASCPDRTVFVRDPDRAAPADHVVDLVLFMRTLTVNRPRRPDRKPDAELVRGEKVKVAMTLGVARLRIELRNLVRLHLVRLVERLSPKFREVREWLRSAGRMPFGKATSQAARGA